MRLNSQNNLFIFNFPTDFIPRYLYEDFERVMTKDFIPYDTVLDYLNSTIKEINFPGMTFESVTQTRRYGKKIEMREAGNIMDKFTRELSITFRSVDGHLNYMMLNQIIAYTYLREQQFIPFFLLQILDKNGDLIYTMYFEDIIIKSLSDRSFGYHHMDLNEDTFTITFHYNFLDMFYEVDEDDKMISISIFDIPLSWTPNTFDVKFNNNPYDHLYRGPKQGSPQYSPGSGLNAAINPLT
jgi:hypothetical protein